MPSGPAPFPVLSWQRVKASFICCLRALCVDRVGHRMSMTAILKSLSFLPPLISAYSWMKVEAFTWSLACTLPMYNSNFQLERNSFPYEERTVDHACLASSNLEILFMCLCMAAHLDSSVSLVITWFVFSQSVIGFEIAVQLIAFLMKLFPLDIYPGNVYFAVRYAGDNLYLSPFYEVTEGLKTFGHGPDTTWMTPQGCRCQGNYRGGANILCGNWGVLWIGHVHLNVLTPDEQQQQTSFFGVWWAFWSMLVAI